MERIRIVLYIFTQQGWSYAARMDWMIWKMAEPQTTKTKRVNSHGPTGDWSSLFFCKWRGRRKSIRDQVNVNSVGDGSGT